MVCGMNFILTSLTCFDSFPPIGAHRLEVPVLARVPLGARRLEALILARDLLCEPVKNLVMVKMYKNVQT